MLGRPEAQHGATPPLDKTESLRGGRTCEIRPSGLDRKRDSPVPSTSGSAEDDTKRQAKAQTLTTTLLP